ncbi:magnesium transporter MgtE N-terminal domain-containing protein [Cellulomonas hominis]
MTLDLTTARPLGPPGRPTAPAGRGLPLDFDLHDVLAVGTRRGLDIWFAQHPQPHVRAGHVADLSDAEVRDLLALLDPTTGRSLLASIDTHTAADVLRVCPPPAAAGLLASLPADLAEALLRELGEPDRSLVLAATGRARSAVAHGLLAWPEGCAAARMTPCADRDLPVDDLAVDALADEAEAAQVLRAHGLVAVPVTDAGHLLGVLTADDLTRVGEQATTQSAGQRGGAAPLGVPDRGAPPLPWRRRIWRPSPRRATSTRSPDRLGPS